MQTKVIPTTEWLFIVLDRLAAYGYCAGAADTNRDLAVHGLAKIVGPTDEYAKLTEFGTKVLNAMRADRPEPDDEN